MSRTPQYKIASLPIWAQELLQWRLEHIEELTDEISMLTSLVDNLEGILEKQAVIEEDKHAECWTNGTIPGTVDL